MSDQFDRAALDDLVLPDFQMDCRDWVVVTPAEAGLSEEAADAPVLAVLSTVVIGTDDLHPASGVLTVGLLGDNPPLTRPIGVNCVAAELIDDSVAMPDAVSYLLPTPDRKMAVVAEFSAVDAGHPELRDRIEALMVSFRWAA